MRGWRAAVLLIVSISLVGLTPITEVAGQVVAGACDKQENVVRLDSGGSPVVDAGGVQFRGQVIDRDENINCFNQPGYEGYHGTEALVRLVNAKGAKQNAYVRFGWGEGSTCTNPNPYDCGGFDELWQVTVSYEKRDPQTGKWICIKPCQHENHFDGQGFLVLEGFTQGAWCDFRLARDGKDGADYLWLAWLNCNGGDWTLVNVENGHIRTPYGFGIPMLQTFRKGGEATGMRDQVYDLQHRRDNNWWYWDGNKCFMDTATNWDANSVTRTSHSVESVPSDSTPTC